MSNGSLRLLAFSDWRVQDVALPAAVLREIGPVDLVVYAGDDVKRVATGPSERDKLLALRAAADAVGGTGGVYPFDLWGGHLAGKPAIAFLYVDPGADIQPLIGDAVWSDDGRRAAVVGGDELRRLSAQRRGHGPWLRGLAFSDTKSTAGADRELIAQAIEFAARANYMPIAYLSGDGPAEPKDFSSDLRRALKLGPPLPTRLERLAAMTRNGAVGVLGNDCEERDGRFLTGAGVSDLHQAPAVIDDWGFIGLQGAPGRLCYILYPEREARTHLDAQLAGLPSDVHGLVIVSHAPPYGTLDLAVRFGIDHIGSVSLARFIARHPALVICGHAHREGGQVAQLGRSTVVNAANHDADGSPAKLAVIELAPGKRPRVVWLKPDLEGLIGVGETIAARLRRTGIHTTTQLARLLREAPAGTRRRGGPVKGLGGYRAHRAALHLEALRTRSFVRDYDEPEPSLLPEPVIFVGRQTETIKPQDGRAEPVRGWCISLLGEGDDIRHFEARAREAPIYRRQLRAAMRSLVAAVTELAPRSVVVWGGAQHESLRVAPQLITVARALRMPEAAQMETWPWHNLRALWCGCLFPPARSWRLGDIRRALGLYPSEFDGYLVGKLYERYLEGGPEPEWSELLRYSESMLRTMRAVNALCVEAADLTPPRPVVVVPALARSRA